MLKITIVVGNPKPNSRTSLLARSLIHSLFGSGDVDLAIIELCDYSSSLFEWPSEVVDPLNARVAASDFALFASPTYKASYTGMLKAFLDRYPANGLRGVTSVALMTGADLGHSMAPTVSLIPLLLELGASVPVRGLYFNTTHFDKRGAIIDSYAEEIRKSITSTNTIYRTISDTSSVK